MANFKNTTLEDLLQMRDSLDSAISLHSPAVAESTSHMLYQNPKAKRKAKDTIINYGSYGVESGDFILKNEVKPKTKEPQRPSDEHLWETSVWDKYYRDLLQHKIESGDAERANRALRFIGEVWNPTRYMDEDYYKEVAMIDKQYKHLSPEQRQAYYPDPREGKSPIPVERIPSSTLGEATDAMVTFLRKNNYPEIADMLAESLTATEEDKKKAYKSGQSDATWFGLRSNEKYTPGKYVEGSAAKGRYDSYLTNALIGGGTAATAAALLWALPEPIFSKVPAAVLTAAPYIGLAGLGWGAGHTPGIFINKSLKGDGYSPKHDPFSERNRAYYHQRIAKEEALRGQALSDPQGAYEEWKKFGLGSPEDIYIPDRKVGFIPYGSLGMEIQQ